MFLFGSFCFIGRVVSTVGGGGVLTGGGEEKNPLVAVAGVEISLGMIC